MSTRTRGERSAETARRPKETAGERHDRMLHEITTILEQIDATLAECAPAPVLASR